MSDAVAALVAELEAAARAAWREEEALRARMAQEVARLERRRQFAHRRVDLVRLLARAVPAGAAAGEWDTAADTPKAQAIADAQRAAARQELNWEGETDFQRAVLDRLNPVGLAVWGCMRGDEAAQPAAVQAALEAFESWYEAAHGQSFYALLDVEPPPVGLVETA